MASEFLIQGADLVKVLRRVPEDPGLELVSVLGNGNTVDQLVLRMDEGRRDALQRELGDDFIIERNAAFDESLPFDEVPPTHEEDPPVSPP